MTQPDRNESTPAGTEVQIVELLTEIRDLLKQHTRAWGAPNAEPTMSDLLVQSPLQALQRRE